MGTQGRAGSGGAFARALRVAPRGGRSALHRRTSAGRAVLDSGLLRAGGVLAKGGLLAARELLETGRTLQIALEASHHGLELAVALELSDLGAVELEVLAHGANHVLDVHAGRGALGGTAGAGLPAGLAGPGRDDLPAAVRVGDRAAGLPLALGLALDGRRLRLDRVLGAGTRVGHDDVGDAAADDDRDDRDHAKDRSPHGRPPKQKRYHERSDEVPVSLIS